MGGYTDKNLEQHGTRMLNDVADHGHDPQALLERLMSLRIEIPSWGFADTGTRFGKFLQPAAATTIEEKLDDAGAGAPAHRHLPDAWPSTCCGTSPTASTRRSSSCAKQLGVKIGAINPNLFQDQCYKFGSLANRDAPGPQPGRCSTCLDSHRDRQEGRQRVPLSLWFADGTNYPGQDDIRARKRRADASASSRSTRPCPPSMTMLVEYKPFEPAFYHTDIADWGMAYLFAKEAGPQAKVLVDTGHHLPGQNIEQIVAWLIDEDMLGGFHFNDRKYADDDLTFSSIDPYAVFRIFHEIASAARAGGQAGGHRLHDRPVAQPQAQDRGDDPDRDHDPGAVRQGAAGGPQEAGGRPGPRRHRRRPRPCLRDAFFTDTRPLVGYARMQDGPGRPTRCGEHQASGYVERSCPGADRQTWFQCRGRVVCVERRLFVIGCLLFVTTRGHSHRQARGVSPGPFPLRVSSMATRLCRAYEFRRQPGLCPVVLRPMFMTAESQGIARQIEHTTLSAETTPHDIDRLCREAIEHHFAGVCVNPRLRRPRRGETGGHGRPRRDGLRLSARCDAPRASRPPRRPSACDDGAAEVDMVAWIGGLLAGGYTRFGLTSPWSSQAAQAVGADAVVKVILETAALQRGGDRQRAADAPWLAGRTSSRRARAFTRRAERRSRRSSARANAGPMKVKAAGGIRDLATPLAMVEAGADRLGTSSGVKIMQAAAGVGGAERVA